jgi:hypothetical protein
MYIWGDFLGHQRLLMASDLVKLLMVLNLMGWVVVHL